MQPTGLSGSLVSAPSLILHGRTEIKARALVLGEVSALSFCPEYLTSESLTVDERSSILVKTTLIAVQRQRGFVYAY